MQNVSSYSFQMGTCRSLSYVFLNYTIFDSLISPTFLRTIYMHIFELIGFSTLEHICERKLTDWDFSCCVQWSASVSVAWRGIFVACWKLLTICILPYCLEDMEETQYKKRVSDALNWRFVNNTKYFFIFTIESKLTLHDSARYENLMNQGKMAIHITCIYVSAVFKLFDVTSPPLFDLIILEKPNQKTKNTYSHFIYWKTILIILQA